MYSSLQGNAAQANPIYGFRNQITGGNTEDVHGMENVISGGTGTRYGVRNSIDNDGTNAGYGIYNVNTGSTGSGTMVGNYTLYNVGTGIKYGTFNILTQSSGSNFIAGTQNNVTHNGTGFAYGFRATMSGTSTQKYGIYTSGEDYNYFQGSIGIGTTNPSVSLDVVGDIQVSSPSNYTYATAKTHYQSFAPTTFNALLPDVYAYGTNNAADYYGYFRSGGTSFGYSTVEVNLPDSALVTELRAWLYDNLNTNPVRMTLYRQAHGSSTIAAMAEVESTAAAASTAVQNLADNTITNAVIDNANYSYFLFFTGRQSSTETRLYGTRITYTVTKTD